MACDPATRSRSSPESRTTTPQGRKGPRARSSAFESSLREVYERLVQAQQGVEALAARYREAERRLEALASEIDRLHDELAKLPAGSTLEQAKADRSSRSSRSRFRDETAAIAESARHPLPIEIDQNLSHELEKLAKALAELTQEAEKLATEKGLKNDAAARATGRASRSLDRPSQAARAKCPRAARSTGTRLSTHRRPGSIRAALPPPA